MVSLFGRVWGMLGPRRRGRWFLDGLKENVEVLTDAAGVPHVYADSLKDAYFVQGYIHARERAFQMELQRRVGQGKLAEIFGPQALPADRFLRKLGLWQRAIRLWPDLDRDVQTLLMIYARGVNHGLQRLRPLECHLLGCVIEPWTALHSLMWTQVMAFDMGSNWEAEWVRWELTRKLGSDGARRHHLEQPHDLPSASGPAAGSAMKELWDDYQAAREVLDQWVNWGGGSNAWAVGPQRSASGKALLASDPHVLAKVPSTWYEVHLEIPDLQLYGVSMPGVPGIVIGQNQHFGWGITNSYVDTQDLVLERIEGNRVLRPDGFIDLIRREERINVRGAKPSLETVLETDSGPLLFHDAEGTAVSMRWTGFSGQDTTLRAWFKLLHCQSVQQAQQALQEWQNPVLNFVLADTQGNIGYQLAGKVPVRHESYGILPQAGWEKQGAWVDWVPPAELPSVYNPECGYVVSANHAPVPMDQTPFLGIDFCDGFRAQRITELLERHDLTLDHFARMQMDTVSLAARQGVQLLRRDYRPDWPGAQLAGELLAWDGDLSAQSRPAALYQILFLELARLVYLPDMGEKLFLHWCGAPVSTLGVLGGQAGRYVSYLLNDWEAAQDRDWPALVKQAWMLALEVATRQMGQDMTQWRWGRLHTFQPSHPLAVVPGLAPLLNAPLKELGGDVTTILQSAVAPQDPYTVKGWVPSYRLLVEMGGSSRSILPTGQAGWVGDAGCFSHVEAYHNGQHHPSLLNRADLERTRPERLILLARNRPR